MKSIVALCAMFLVAYLSVEVIRTFDHIKNLGVRYVPQDAQVVQDSQQSLKDKLMEYLP
jgi:hypothetical protein